MRNDENDGWFNNTRLSVMSFALTVIGILYMAVIQGNDLKNTVKNNEIQLNKIETQIIGLEAKKLDKETFALILTTLTELRSDIRDFQISLNEHVNKGK